MSMTPEQMDAAMLELDIDSSDDDNVADELNNPNATPSNNLEVSISSTPQSTTPVSAPTAPISGGGATSLGTSTTVPTTEPTEPPPPIPSIILPLPVPVPTHQRTKNSLKVDSNVFKCMDCKYPKYILFLWTQNTFLLSFAFPYILIF